MRAILGDQRVKAGAIVLAAVLLAVGSLAAGGFDGRLAIPGFENKQGSVSGTQSMRGPVDQTAPAPVEGEHIVKSIGRDDNGGSVDYSLSLPAFGKDVIKNASINLSVKEGYFGRTYDQVAALAEADGGYVAGSNASTQGREVISGSITIRVPNDKFETVMAKVRRLAKVTGINIDSADVSTEIVDLDSRLRHLRAQETVMLKLMEKAQTIGDSISVQQQLSSIQQEIERITGRLEYLKDQVALSNITVTISEPGAAPAPADSWGFEEALEQAGRAFLNSVAGLILLAAYLGPYILLGLAVWPAVKARRRPVVG